MFESARTGSEDPKEWLRRVRSNAQLARCREAGVDPADLCFQAQQAAEKAIKAVLVRRGVPIPHVHDLQVLLRSVERAGVAVPMDVAAADALTEFAVEARYPGSARVGAAKYEMALRLLDVVLAWAEHSLAPHDEVRERKTGPGYYGILPRGESRGPDPELLRVVLERVVQVAEPERMILFGSAARGDMHVDSDLDLLIVKAGVYDSFELKVAIRRALRGLGCPIDLVVVTPETLERYGRSPGLVYLQALEEGVVVYDAGRGSPAG